MTTRARNLAPRPGVLAVLVTAAVAAGALALATPPAAAAPLPWCGNDVTAGDRFPDDVAGAQIHVIYAFPSDGGDRFRELAPAIAGDLAAIDEWWRREDPTRAPRFDLFDFPGCGSTFGRLDLSSVRLPRPAAAYDQTTIGAVSDAIYRDLRASATLRTPHAFKKYFVYYDGPATRMEDACAVSFGDPANVAFMFLQPPVEGCPPVDAGAGGFTAMVTAHELIHNLGATGRTTGAPNKCNNGHVCDAAADVVYGEPVFRPLFERVLDAGRDDYYAHGGSWFDVQDSPFLQHVGAAQRELAVRMTGDGRVRTDLPGLLCPPTCAAAWDTGTVVVLQASARTGSRFSRWSGACSGAYSRCRLTLNRVREVSAEFVKSSATPTTGTARNWAPVARIAYLQRTSYEPGERVVFTSQSRDRDGSLASQEWDFGDGQRASGPSVSHVYANVGSFTVTLRVVDNRGASKSATVSLSIRPSPPYVYAFQAYARSGERVSLRYRASDNARVERVRIAVFRGLRRVHARTLRPRRSSVDGAYVWRVPRRKSDFTWCLTAWDSRGYVSKRVCSPIRVF